MTVGPEFEDTSNFFFFTFFHNIASHTKRRCPSTFCAHHQYCCRPTQYQLVRLHVTFVRGVAPLVLSPAEHTAATVCLTVYCMMVHAYVYPCHHVELT